MPKVRILSGNDAGAVVEMPDVEAQSAVATGFAEVVPHVDRRTRRRLAEAEAKAKTEAEAKAKAETKARGR